MSHPANTRPRRTNANLHPGKIVLDQKTPRRSSAEVAQERAALEAERQKLLKKQEAAMKALADLEARLLEGKEQSQQDTVRRSRAGQSTRKPSGSASQSESSSRSTRAAPGGGKPRDSTGNNTAVTATPSGRATASEDIPSTPTPVTAKKVAQPKRIQKLTRAEFEAYRDAQKTQITKQKENVEPLARRKRALEDSLNGGNCDKDTESQITTPPSKKGKTSSADTPPLTQHSPHPPSPASNNPTTATTEALPIAETELEAGIIEQFGGYGEDESDEQVRADRSELERVQSSEPGPASATKPTSAEEDSTSNQSLKALQPILGETVGRFTYHFIPKLINTIGNSASGPWRLYGFDLVGAMKAHAAQVWPDIDIDISPRHAFHDLAKQKISDYRAVMGQEAIEVVSKYMMSRRFTGREERKEWVHWALDPKAFPFRYEKVVQTADGEVALQKKYGIYQHKFILKTLAYHLKRIQIPVEQIKDYPCNALALATTAVERALRAWETGEFKKPRGAAGQFSDRNWGRSANEYLANIINLHDEKWNAILTKAEQYARCLVDESDDDESDYGDYDADDVPANSGRATMEDCDDEDQDVEMGEGDEGADD
ncbi:hypothetical protein OH76DRAFT_1422804 [Lentinus brumalis]|uniref:DUF6532 domain-containing protein n=1 Tax=Lentinus brumalis TaxID=2498619 RepID=A0A371CNR2_9APHY|nr:hypothetical protein OH76DRAFT_1422804 [Polyporus brumalis]